MAAETILPFGMARGHRLYTVGLMASHTVFLIRDRLMLGTLRNYGIPVLWRRQHRDANDHGDGKDHKEPIDFAQCHDIVAFVESAESYASRNT